MGYDTFTRAIYSRFRIGDIESAVAIAAVLVVITVVLLLLVRDARKTSPPPSGRAGREPAVVNLSRATRTVATGALTAIVVLSTVLPTTVLVAWTIRGTSAFEGLLDAALGSFGRLVEHR